MGTITLNLTVYMLHLMLTKEIRLLSDVKLLIYYVYLLHVLEFLRSTLSLAYYYYY